MLLILNKYKLIIMDKSDSNYKSLSQRRSINHCLKFSFNCCNSTKQCPKCLNECQVQK